MQTPKIEIQDNQTRRAVRRLVVSQLIIRMCARTHKAQCPMHNGLARSNKQRAIVVITLPNIEALNAQNSDGEEPAYFHLN